jgi:hypothetical protein
VQARQVLASQVVRAALRADSGGATPSDNQGPGAREAAYHIMGTRATPPAVVEALGCSSSSPWARKAF